MPGRDLARDGDARERRRHRAEPDRLQLPRRELRVLEVRQRRVHFRTRPPDDELTVLRMRCEDSGLAVADYARKSNPAEIAGELRITIQSNRIIGIEVLVND